MALCQPCVPMQTTYIHSNHESMSLWCIKLPWVKEAERGRGLDYLLFNCFNFIVQQWGIFLSVTVGMMTSKLIQLVFFSKTVLSITYEVTNCKNGWWHIASNTHEERALSKFLFPIITTFTLYFYYIFEPEIHFVLHYFWIKNPSFKLVCLKHRNWV